jgi:uncharacterized protein (DUF4415 family)
MTVRRRSAAEARIYTELLALIDAIERAEAGGPPSPVALPASRRCVSPAGPDAPEKVQDTIFVDAETAKWFRAGGRGFQRRINLVLRSYMVEAVARAETRARKLLAPPHNEDGGGVSGDGR